MSNATQDLLPRNIDAEEALLGSILIDEAVLCNNDVEKLHLTGDDFYIRRNGWVFDALLELHQNGKPLDLVMISDILEKNGRLDELGGAARLTELMNVTPTSIHGPHYAKIVADKSARRKMIDVLADLTRQTYNETTDLSDIATSAETNIANALNGRAAPQATGATWQELSKVIGPIEWDWEQWLPKGLLTMVVSESGAGKSALALSIAACYLRGDNWPDGKLFFGDTGSILWCEAEAAQAVNLSRANEWRLPIDRILTPLNDPLADIELDNPDHQKAIIAMAQKEDVRFVVVDSLSGGTRKDSQKAADMMNVVKMLANVAKATNKPVLLTHHLRKRGILDSNDKITLDRVRDSSAIVQLARVIWALDTPDPEAEDHRRLSVIKNNLARFAEPIGLRVNETGIDFGEAPEAPRQETLQDKAADLLLSLLTKGPIPATQIQKEVEEAGLSWDAAKRAKGKLNIVSVKPGGIWHWSLPAKEE